MILHIIGKKTIEYVFEAMARLEFNDKVTLRAYGGNTNKGLEVAHILHEQHPDVIIEKSDVGQYTIANATLPMLTITLAWKRKKREEQINKNILELEGSQTVINYPTYHLLSNWALDKGSLNVFIRNYSNTPFEILHFNKISKNSSYSYEVKFDKLKSKSTKSFEYTSRKEAIQALSRAGMLMPKGWQKSAQKLSEFDDVIIGCDTNLFIKSGVTTHLLPALSLIEPISYAHTPNWILFVVPATVMYELEETTNKRDDLGLLNFKGRMGFRALQEIMELSQTKDIQGVALTITGDAKDAFNLNSITDSLNNVINHFADTFEEEKSVRYRRNSSSDMLIRTQFKHFLKNIDFHKGAFFLTADKTNAAMAQTEGLTPVYIKYNSNLPVNNLFTNLSITPTTLPCEKSKKEVPLSMDIPLGSVLYELAVSFGEIILKNGPYTISLKCDRKGESLMPWVKKQLWTNSDELDELVKYYNGRYNLNECYELFETLSSRIDGTDWLGKPEGAFS